VESKFTEPPVFIFLGSVAVVGAAAAARLPLSSSDVIEPPLELRLLERGIHKELEFVVGGK
jgi:hypothetical protein